MKKVWAWFLALCLLMPLGIVMAEDAQLNDLSPEAIEAAWAEIGVQDDELVVGSTTQLSGFFGTNMWGNNTADIDARALLTGYSTVAWASNMTLNASALASIEVKNDTETSRTYVFTLEENLAYNDGTPITARDYVFSILLCGSPYITEIGGTPNELFHLVGYREYFAGTTNYISGVRLLDDYSFSLEVLAEYLPFFYGLALLEVTPYPIQALAPGCEVYDEGDGVYIAAQADVDDSNAEQLGYTPGQFSAEMLQVTMLDPEDGYVYNPRVTAGPYALESYDTAEHVATFTRNPFFLGDYQGQKPHIERITFKHVKSDEIIDQLMSGEVDLVNKVSDPQIITEGLALGQAGNFQWSNYMRSGLAYIAFACEQDPTSSVAVRNAIARCFDKTALVAEVGGNFAQEVYGYYGLGQWMMTRNFEDDQGGEDLNLATEVRRFAIEEDMDEAKRLLVEDGWTLNELGEPFVEGEDAMRYRLQGETLQPLLIKWAKTAESEIADAIEETLAEPFAALGIGLEVTEMSFSDMLQYYYREQERPYNMFYLASNFNFIYDPYLDFSVYDQHQGHLNKTALKDAQLMDLAWDMRMTRSDAPREYAEKFLVFQERWVELMPMVPLYSNVYFDFYTNELRDYDVYNTASWGLAMPYVWYGEKPVTDAGPGDGGFIMLDD